MDKRIALTGATGFVGKHLLKNLTNQGYKVKALTRNDQTPVENVEWIKGDFENISAIKKLIHGTDIVINVAGLVKAKNNDEFLKANTTAISTLLNEINTQNISPHFIQISSLTARKPEISDYAMSKYKGEEILKSNNLNLNWTIIRPPAIYGPYDIETLKIFKLLKWRVALYPGSRLYRVSWIHIADLVSAISVLINNTSFFNKTLEIDDGHKSGYSHEEFFKTAAAAMNVTPINITTPKMILKLVGHTNNLLSYIFNYAPMVSAKKVNELCDPDWVCKKNDEFNSKVWKPKYNLEKGLKETLDWYKTNNYF